VPSSYAEVAAVYKTLRAIDPAAKPFLVLIACYAVSNLLRLLLPLDIAYGIGFCGGMMIMHPILEKPNLSIWQWLVSSIFVGLISLLVVHYFFT
jgi:hypothetical protein